jgi:hypothetical protein
MTLLGELHKDERFSTLWDWEKSSKSDASLGALLPIIQEQAVPSCPKPRMWTILEEIIKDPLNRRHHIKIPTCARPGKVSNGQDGCRHHGNPSNATLARHHMAENPAIIASAVIMATHPMPALARHQPATGSETIAMQPHLKGHQNASEYRPRPQDPLHREENSNQW